MRVVPAALWMCIAAFGSHAEAAVRIYQPTDAQQVILKLDPQSHEATAQRLEQMRVTADTDPDQFLAYIDSLLNAGVASGNERYYGYAEQALNSAPPQLAERLSVARAQVLQHRHDFRGAEASLAALLTHNPRERNARLLRAQIRVHLLDGKGAMQDCAALMQVAELAMATLCMAQARATNGDLDGAYRMAVATLQSQPMNDATRAWGAGIAAEIAARRGDDDDADRWYRKAFELDSTTHYPRVALADWLLSQRQFAAARAVAASGSSPADQIRIVLAERDAHAALAEQLQLAWREASARGERGHLRDAARFEWEVLHDVQRAHATALNNFKDRQEPEDAAILAVTANAVHDTAALSTVRAWQVKNHYRDVRLDGYLGAGT